MLFPYKLEASIDGYYSEKSPVFEGSHLEHASIKLLTNLSTDPRPSLRWMRRLRRRIRRFRRVNHTEAPLILTTYKHDSDGWHRVRRVKSKW